MSKLSVAIVGAGIGGLAAAACLRRIGIHVTIYEQANKFTRVGAGIQMSPNAMRVLRAIGLEDYLRRIAFTPTSFLNRESKSGEITNDHPLGEAAEERFGAPYLLMHRADLHEAIASTVPESAVLRNRKLAGVEQNAERATLRFDDGSAASADLVIGADGVHSTIREWMLGAENPRWTGRVAYRTTFPAALLGGMEIESSCTKWWGPDRHIVTYYTTAARDEVYFVTSQPEPVEWMTRESWSATGDLQVLRDAFAGFHPNIQRFLAACPQVHKWVLLERDPLPKWCEGRVTLLGDACHPMTPYMAQGAATSLEDAAVLSRCLEGVDADGVTAALKRFEAHRLPRTAEIQRSSHTNTWMQKRTDPAWVYGYDAWSADLDA
jgi:6-hydroxynicotinate 3-monooxygenase